MLRYHRRALDLLGVSQPDSIARNQKVRLYQDLHKFKCPAAFLEWSDYDQTGILRKYSNCDHFDFDEPSVVQLDDGRSGLLFHKENQGNFSMLALLNEGDDPPVLFRWAGRAPWIEHSAKFSDFVFAQLFDWQYLLDFSGDYPEMAYTGGFRISNKKCVDYFRENYTEEVATHVLIDDREYTTLRFYRRLDLRVNCGYYEENSECGIKITGKQKDIKSLENELVSVFSENVNPPKFNLYSEIGRLLAVNIEAGAFEVIRHSSLRSVDNEALESIAKAHQSMDIRKRVPTGAIRGQSYIEIGGKEWGVKIGLSEITENWWSIESIEKVD